MEALQRHAPNAINFQMATGGRLWHVIGSYIVPHGASTLERVVAAIGHIPWGAELLIAGDFNADLSAPDGNECN